MNNTRVFQYLFSWVERGEIMDVHYLVYGFFNSFFKEGCCDLNIPKNLDNKQIYG